MAVAVEVVIPFDIATEEIATGLVIIDDAVVQSLALSISSQNRGSVQPFRKNSVRLFLTKWPE
jgi:uncharacterized membrane protein YkvA (DUF1232 family)